MKRIRLSGKELRRVIKESVKTVLGELRSARLDEMARVGFIGGEYEVYVRTDDAGYKPHLHIWDTNTRGGNFETCVKLETNEYFLHGHYRDRMNAGMRKAFNDFMHDQCRLDKYQNNYEFAVDMWNCNNSSVNIIPRYDADGRIIVPDYTVIRG